MKILNIIRNPFEPFKIITIGILTLILTTVLVIKISNAQTINQCNIRESVIQLLSNKYKESPVAVGITNTGGLVEVLSARDGGTWSIIVTSPQGMTCLVAAGEGWRALKYTSEDPGA